MTREDIYSTLKYESMITDMDTPPDTPTLSRSRVRVRVRSRLSTHRRKPQVVAEREEPDRDKVVVPERCVIRWDREYVEAVLRKHESRGYLTLQPDRLKYHPFLVTRNPAKSPGAIARATLVANNPNAQRAGESASSREEEVVETPATDGEGEGDERVVAGEDRATLDLVAELSVSPKRNLRKRTSGELNSESVKARLRKSERRGSATPFAPRRSLRGAAEIVEKQTRPDQKNGGDAEQEDDDDDDDPLRLGKGMNGTPRQPARQRGKAVPVDEEMNGGDEDADGEEDMEQDADGDDVDVEMEDEDGGWEGDDVDAEGEDDQECTV